VGFLQKAAFLEKLFSKGRRFWVVVLMRRCMGAPHLLMTEAVFPQAAFLEWELSKLNSKWETVFKRAAFLGCRFNAQTHGGREYPSPLQPPGDPF
jgi:hypothetical protein